MKRCKTITNTCERRYVPPGMGCWATEYKVKYTWNIHNTKVLGFETHINLQSLEDSKTYLPKHKNCNKKHADWDTLHWPTQASHSSLNGLPSLQRQVRKDRWSDRVCNQLNWAPNKLLVTVILHSIDRGLYTNTCHIIFSLFQFFRHSC